VAKEHPEQSEFSAIAASSRILAAAQVCLSMKHAMGFANHAKLLCSSK
jgi:hypothetical protein